MTLKEIILNAENYDGNLVIYAQKSNDIFLPESDAVLLELSDEELDKKTSEIADSKCPGYAYFLEMFQVKEWAQDLKVAGYQTTDEVIDRIIYYAENDA